MATKSFMDDRRGAVLLVAVFMSAFLVGALWYVIGIGDAAIYRQYLQDGSDAVAFGSAVYHARGMNILALINLVMAAVLMVLVAFKIGQLLLAAANIASCLIGAFLNPVCDATTAAETPYENLVTKVEKLVDGILKVLKKTSDGVAYGMPWVAEGKAVVVSQEYKSTVTGGFMISISLIPGPVESAIGGLVSKEKPTGKAATTPTGETKKSEDGAVRLGLPVQDDEYSVLCKHAGENVAHLVFLPFHLLPGFGALAGGVEKFTSGLVGGLVKTFPGYFCGDMSDAAKGLGDKIKSDILKGSKDKADELCKKREKDAKDESAKAKKDGLPPIPFDMKKCLDATGKAFGVLDKAGGPSLGKDKTSKKVYDAASAGDDYFAIWGFGWGDLDNQSSGPKGLNVAGWGAKTSGANTFSKVGIAKAEFYYEPKPEDPKKWGKDFGERVPGSSMFGKPEGGLAEEAMWNMRWRARLRRLRLPTPSAGAWLATKVNDKIKVPVVGDMLKWPADKLGEIVDDKVSEYIGSLTSGWIVH